MKARVSGDDLTIQVRVMNNHIGENIQDSVNVIVR
jgi:hypothetical protein